jgi:4-hydroxy-3-polyprenylbenzoate decarboxylase
MTYAKTVTVALTGASGIQYALRLIECLIQAQCQVYVLMSKPAKIVMGMDTNIPVPSTTADIQAQFSARYSASDGQLLAFGQEQWTAPVASGSGVPDAMVVCPCTTGSLASLAAGNCNNLLERAADVVLKEGRQLIIMPPNPAFYNQPGTIDELIDFVVARVLDQLVIKQTLMPRWGIDKPGNR